MKRILFFSAFAVFAFISSFQPANAQPGYRSGPYRTNPDYNRQQSLPGAPVIIIDADGRRPNNQYGNFDNCFNQQTFNRKQRKKLEKRFGYVPPLAIYVPDRFVDRSGVYVYNNNIVYRKDKDGFFHLDSRYFSDSWDDYNRYDRYEKYGKDDRRWSSNYPNRY